MQRKNTIPVQPSFADMHFAVVPYEVQYSVPNDQIYSLYFEKGLQILGQTHYPIENHQKLNKIQIPIQQNVIPFRLFSDKNAEYQWSIYKRVSEMQEFLEAQKINLKDILKKQPQKKCQAPKLELQRKQTSTKSEIKKFQQRKNSIRGSGLGASEFTSSIQANLQQKNTDTGSEGTNKLYQAKGVVYNQNIISEMGKFTLKFYLFKASSNQDLSKTIEQKVKSIRQAKAGQNENSELKLPNIIESDPLKEVQSSRNTLQMDKQMSVADQILPNESAKKFTEEIDENVPEEARNLQTQEPLQAADEPIQQKVIEQPEYVKKVIVQEIPEPFSETIFVDEQIADAEAFTTGENPVQVIVQKPIEEPVRGSSGLKRTDSVIIEDDTKKQVEKVEMKKRRTPSIYVAGILIILWVLSYLNVFNISGYVPEGLKSAFNTTSTLKRGKKERFLNRKKLSN